MRNCLHVLLRDVADREFSRSASNEEKYGCDERGDPTYRNDDLAESARNIGKHRQINYQLSARREMVSEGE